MSLFYSKKESMKEENKVNKYGLFIVIAFLVWLIIPPRNNFAQLCSWAYTLSYKTAKALQYDTIDTYMYLRNKAVYEAKIHPKNPKYALKKFDEAFKALEADSDDARRSVLRKDRAIVKIYYGDKKGALEDLVMVEDLEKKDYLKIALLFADIGKYDKASENCATVMQLTERGMMGYVCYAYVYEKKKEIVFARRIYDYLIEQNPNNSVAYIERAFFKKRLKCVKEYNEDMQKAKTLYPNWFYGKTSIIDEAVNFKKLPLQIE